METLLLYIIPSIICFFVGGPMVWSKVRFDLDMEGCLTIGAILLIPAWLVITFVPGLSFIGAFAGIVGLLIAYDVNIGRFMRKPICSIKKKKA